MLLILVVILVLGLFGGPAPPSLRKQLAGVGLGLIIICFALAMIAQATGSTVIERIAHGLLWILIIGGMVGFADRHHHSDASATGVRLLIQPPGVPAVPRAPTSQGWTPLDDR